MRLSTPASLLILSTILFTGCAQKQVVKQSRSVPKPILIDEYSALDDKRTAPSLADEQIRKRMELARAHYLKALKLVEGGNQKDAAKHFEASVAILNELMNHPDIDALPEYTRLSQSVIRDYEDKITSTDDLDSTSSFFVLRDKMFEEIELLPVSFRPASSSVAETKKPDTLQIKLVDNEAVEQTIAYFTTGRGRKHMASWLSRTGRFFPMYERVMAEEGAPDELKYLSMIESGLNPRATSKAAAVGLWQFISSTGREYGMRNDWYRDERRDPEKATRAAARYLLDLFEQMGDWHLALASYNCGPGRMRRAIRSADTSDYWIARKYLPSETRQYVPLYIAAATIARNPEAFGFTDIKYETPDRFETVAINASYHLNTLADAANTSIGVLRDLNPELLQDRIPPGERDYPLRVPEGHAHILLSALDTMSMNSDEEISWVKHKVQSGETVTRIASKYGVSVGDVLDANGMTSSSKLLRGKILKIPVTAVAADDVIAEADAESDDSKSSSTTSNAAATSSTAASSTVAVAEQRSESVATTPHGVTGKSNSTPVADSQIDVDEFLAPTAERKADQRQLSAVDIAARNAAQEKDVTTGPESLKVATAKTPVRENEAREATTSTSTRTEKATESPVAKTKTATTPSVVYHKVGRGETLSGIARQYGVSMNEIKSWNRSGINDNNEVLLGAKLKIYPAGTAAKTSARDVASTSKRSTKKSTRVAQVSRYKVRRGETLTDIASRFNVSVKTLRDNNPRVNPNRIRAGQVLKIK